MAKTPPITPKVKTMATSGSCTALRTKLEGIIQFLLTPKCSHACTYITQSIVECSHLFHVFNFFLKLRCHNFSIYLVVFNLKVYVHEILHVHQKKGKKLYSPENLLREQRYIREELPQSPELGNQHHEDEDEDEVENAFYDGPDASLSHIYPL